MATTTPKDLDGALEALAEAHQRIADLEDPKRFSSAVRLLERGMLDRQLGDELADLSETILAEQKKGTITLKLEITHDDSDEDRLKFVADFAARPPKVPRKASTIFRDRDGGLTRNFPRQLTSSALGGEEA